MVERDVEKKIRVLKEISKEPADWGNADEGAKKPLLMKWLSTIDLNVDRLKLRLILVQLGLKISTELESPFVDNEHLFSVVINKEDIERLSPLLKEYEGEFPKRKRPFVREKTLELIAKKIGDLDSAGNLIKFLKNCGVDEELIVYPQTKWRMVVDILVYLANSNKEGDKNTLSKIIGEATHPLMHNGDEMLALLLRKQFDEYLKYDNVGIAYDKSKGAYEALRIASKEEAEIETQMESENLINDLEERSKEQLEFLSKPENIERISLLRKTYQLLMNVVFFFCEDHTHPTVELNQSFQYLNKLTNSTIHELGLSGVDISPFSRDKHFFCLPFSNLFSAEQVYKEQEKELSWQRIRPEMNAMYGDIEELYQEVSGSDVLAEPDKQEKLNKIQLSLSVLKKKREIAKKMVRRRHNGTQAVGATAKIEITKLPELQIKGFEEKVVLQKPKNKRIQLHKFPSDLRWEEISIRFLNEQEVIIKARNETLQTTYEAMGFQDEKRKLPNRQWQLLQLLSLKNGEISWESNQDLPLKQIQAIKKQKQLLTETLKAYFQINTNEPFHDYKTEKAYRIKLILIPEPKDTE